MTGTRRATTVAVTMAALTTASLLAACGASNGGKAAAKGWGGGTRWSNDNGRGRRVGRGIRSAVLGREPQR